MPCLQRLLVIRTPRVLSEFPLIVRHLRPRKSGYDWLAVFTGILVFAQTVDARSLAVTEFLNNPSDSYSWPKNAPTVSPVRLCARVFTQVATYIAPVG